MFSPEGFTPLSEIHRLAPIEDSLYPKEFMNLVAEQPSIYVCSKEGSPLKVDGRILSIYGATYLFIDPVLWVVSFERIRRSAWNESHVLGGSNCENPPEIDLVSLVRSIKSRLYEASLDGIPDDFTVAIQPLEGLPIILPDADAKSLVAALISVRSQKANKRLSPIGEGRKAFINFLESCPNLSPTEKERDAWSKENLRGGREAGRVLWRELKPEDGSKPGPKSP